LQVQDADSLGGDVCCSPAELPFADESFRLVVLQHAFELVSDPAGLRAEAVRVLEPGGIAMICGFAPYGAWRPWLLWLGRNATALQCVSAGGWRRALASAGVDTYVQRRVGPARLGVGLALPPLLRPSWLLLARKSGQAARLRAQTIALRPHGVRARLASGTQRASA
jgi:SAM-dependent methyltransferase